MLRYEFEFDFELPALYPSTAPEIRLPCLVGKTAKQYRGGMRPLQHPVINEAASVELMLTGRFQISLGAGAICLTVHFKPLWKANAPSFGIAHALCMGLGPWLAAEVPHLASSGAIEEKS